jgi:O-antigen/teichoic acid export membrane protein
MSGIRVTYSGLISLSIRLSSIITGLVFTLIVTRQLTQDEFGTWGVINGIFIYAIAIHPIITYWATREIARGEKSGKTVFLSSSSFSILGLVIYIAVAAFVSFQSDAEFEMLVFAAILIPMIFVNDSLSAISLGSKPQVVSYGFLAFEITKIPLGFLLVYFLQLGLEGAIIATFGAYVPSIIIMGIKTRHNLRSSINKKFIKKWMNLFWVPSYRNIPSLISMSDVIVFSTITGSVSGVAYYTAARTIGFLVNHTRSFSEALYPKMLETGKHDFLGENLIKLFYFALPLVGLSIVLAKPGLFALNPIYEIAEPVVILLAIRSFLTTFGKILFQALQGIEKVDLDKNASFRDYAASKLILYPTFQLIRNIIYFGSLAIILFLLHSEKTEIELVIYWAIVGLIVEIPLTIYIYRLVKKNMQFNINVTSLLKYLFSTVIVFGFTYVLITMFLEYKISIFEFLPQVIGLTIISGIGYIGLTYAIDNKTRILVKAVISELLPRKEKS